MILNGKAKEEFLEWYFNTYLKKNKYILIKDIEELFLSIEPVFQNVLIIEWFDSVGIYIYFNTGTYVLTPNFRYEVITEDNIYIGYKENSRKEATIQAIKKANKIYNERFK